MLFLLTNKSITLKLLPVATLIVGRSHFEGMKLKDTAQYLKWHLEIAGIKEHLFTEESALAIPSKFRRRNRSINCPFLLAFSLFYIGQFNLSFLVNLMLEITTTKHKHLSKRVILDSLAIGLRRCHFWCIILFEDGYWQRKKLLLFSHDLLILCGRQVKLSLI